MLGGLLVGGLLGSLLFGGGLGGHGLFGGVGLLEIVVIGGLALMAFSWMRRRQMESPGAPGYAGGYGGGWTPAERTSATVLEGPAALSDLERGLGHIRQMDPAFDPVEFAETASDLFFKIQAAWTTRDVSGVADLLTPEMRSLLQSQCDRLRAERKINRLENIAVRRAEVTEAWQERGQDYATVYFLATVLDYTTDESGTQVLEGSRAEPVKFEEYWTFVRPVGPNRWTLSAIQQSS
jgi:predicted lipid-binding transport protein (Tim44 family)